MKNKQLRRTVAPAICLTLTAGVIIGIPLLVSQDADAHGAIARVSSSVPARERVNPAASFTKVRPARIGKISGIGGPRRRIVKVTGHAGIPSAGVKAVKVKVTMVATRSGKASIGPVGKRGYRSTVTLKAGKSTKRTITKVIGTKGRWYVKNQTRGSLSVTISARGFVSSSIANSATPCGRISTAPTWDHVVWVMLENHGPASVAAKAPYLTSLASSCGSATNMWARTHPSLPNYIALTSGSRQGITDNELPAVHPLSVPSIFSQLGSDWKTLAQTMPSNCYKQNSGSYVARHNPATYYTNLGGTCESQNIPMGQTPDLSAKFTLVVPDNYSNGHDAGIEVADSWMKGYLPKILDSPQYRAGRTAVFVFFDEGEGKSDVESQINLFVLSPSTPKKARDSTRLTHYSTLRATQEMLGLGLLGGAGTATDMRAGFNLR